MFSYVLSHIILICLFVSSLIYFSFREVSLTLSLNPSMEFKISNSTFSITKRSFLAADYAFSLFINTLFSFISQVIIVILKPSSPTTKLFWDLFSQREISEFPFHLGRFPKIPKDC